MQRIQHTPEQMQAMRLDYEHGMTLEFVGKKYHIAWMTARDRIVTAGGTIRPKNTPIYNTDQLIQDWLSGMHINDMADKHMYENPRYIYQIIQRIRRRGVNVPCRRNLEGV